MSGVGLVAGAGIAVMLIALVIMIGLYVIISMMLSRLHEFKYGKRTILAWIPVCSTYILGKDTFNKAVGWALVIASIVFMNYSTVVDGSVESFSLLPSSLAYVGSSLLSFVNLGLLIYAAVLYFKLKD